MLEEIFKKAFNDDYEAQQYVANMHYEDHKAFKKIIRKILWYKKEALLGNSEVQLRLANRYYKGNGINKDFQKAFDWYEKAAVQG
ncbi:MAG TPA: sel1 repeat family protein, partial [Candidatus Wallbacteria bacterium]|nr:sel1 repeat family protein [Candidatus Wallbacteria bacterium]